MTKLISEAQNQHNTFESILVKTTQYLEQRIESHLQKIVAEAEKLTGLQIPANQGSKPALNRSLPLWASLKSAVKVHGPRIWGPISFDIFNAFDAPLSACGTLELKAFTNAVNKKIGELGVNRAILDLSTLDVGFSLHSTDDDRKPIDDKLKLFQFKTTALTRMEQAVLHRIDVVLKTMQQKVAERMRQRLTEALTEATDHLAGLRQRVDNLKDLLMQQQEKEPTLRQQTQDERAREHDQRLTELNERIKRLEQFRVQVISLRKPTPP